MYQILLEEFASKGIPIDEPNFYDHANFLTAEQNDPSYLIKFSQFVATKSYSKEYIESAREIITKTARILSNQLIKNGRQGACLDIASILSRMLELNGIWCTCIKGSCTIDYPSKSNEERTYFWSYDNREFAAPHVWLFAPPFAVVDITLKQQPYSGNEKQYIPDIILCENGTKATTTIEDIISPEARAQMKAQGLPKSLFLKYGASEMEVVQETMPALTFEKDGTIIKYSPIAVHASLESLPDITNMEFNGESPFELYVKEIRDVVGKIV